MRRQYPPFVTGVIALFACAAVAKATPVVSLSVGGTVLPSVSGMVTDTVASGTFNGSVFTAFGFPLAGSIQVERGLRSATKGRNRRLSGESR